MSVRFNLTDVGNAQRFVAQHKENVLSGVEILARLGWTKMDPGPNRGGRSTGAKDGAENLCGSGRGHRW